MEEAMSLRDEIANVIADEHGGRAREIDKRCADRILALPEMVEQAEKARKWDEMCYQFAHPELQQKLNPLEERYVQGQDTLDRNMEQGRIETETPQTNMGHWTEPIN